MHFFPNFTLHLYNHTHTLAVGCQCRRCSIKEFPLKLHGTFPHLHFHEHNERMAVYRQVLHHDLTAARTITIPMSQARCYLFFWTHDFMNVQGPPWTSKHEFYSRGIPHFLHACSTHLTPLYFVLKRNNSKCLLPNNHKQTVTGFLKHKQIILGDKR